MIVSRSLGGVERVQAESSSLNCQRYVESRSMRRGAGTLWMQVQQRASKSHVQKSRGERGMRQLTCSCGPRAMERWTGDTAGRTALEN
jgi:hypothetical protein